MTLFEAIRQLKEGQAIPEPDKRCRVFNPYLLLWGHGHQSPSVGGICDEDWAQEVCIIDLPKPKITLEEGLTRAWREDDSPADTVRKLRKYNIDWQAEANRAKEEGPEC